MPHIKTHKSVEIARRQIAEGAVGLTCAKLGEAEIMADAGIRELLIAYPIVGESKLSRLVALARRANVTVALDSLEVAEGIAKAASDAGIVIGVLAETDTGTKRCGSPPGLAFLDLCHWMTDRPGLDFMGVMTYQGHLSGVEATRDALIEKEAASLDALYDMLRKDGIPFPVVSAGSSPNLKKMHRLPGITSVRHGTYVFNDRNTLAQEGCVLEDCALTVAVTVVSASVSGQIIIDGGTKAFSADRLALGGEGFGLCVEDPSLVLVKTNEEHGYVDITRSERKHKIGDRLHFIPNHVCVCVNLYDRLYPYRGDEVVDIWKVDARGKSQ